MRQLTREIMQLRQDPPEGIRISVNEENILDFTGILEGPGSCAWCFGTCTCWQAISRPIVYANLTIKPHLAGTPYEGGYFRVKFNFTDEFPAAPPKCLSRDRLDSCLKLSMCYTGHFVTKLFHPNVSSSGEICVNTLKKDWQPSFGISHILVTIKCLLIYPNPESALDEEAGKLLLEDYTEFEKRAKLICEIHAQPKVRAE